LYLEQHDILRLLKYIKGRYWNLPNYKLPMLAALSYLFLISNFFYQRPSAMQELAAKVIRKTDVAIAQAIPGLV